MLRRIASWSAVTLILVTLLYYSVPMPGQDSPTASPMATSEYLRSGSADTGRRPTPLLPSQIDVDEKPYEIGERPIDSLPEHDGTSVLKVYPLKHAVARDAASIIEFFMNRRGKSLRVGTDKRTNAVLVLGDSSHHADVAATLELLDIPGPIMKETGVIDDGVALPQDSVMPAPPGTAARPNAALSVLRLENARALDVWNTARQVFADEGLDLVVDGRTNSLLLYADSATSKKIEELVKKLDEADSAVAPPSGAVEAERTYETMPGLAYPPTPLARPSGVRSNVAELRRMYEELDQRSKQLAEQLRGPLPDPGTRERLKIRLREAVRQAFEAQQAWQKAELSEFTRRLHDIQQTLERRERIRQDIIDRRVDELLDPNVNWENNSRSPTKLGPPPNVKPGAGTDSSPRGQTVPSRNKFTPRLPATLVGIVLQRNEDSLVELSLGADDSVRPGDRFRVQVAQEKVGEMEVVSVEAKRSVARVVSESEFRPIRNGDTVYPLPTDGEDESRQDRPGDVQPKTIAPCAVESK